jgi:hypothetical protein
MMVAIWGLDEAISFCKLNAFKYKMRVGTKPNETIDQDLKKEKWYLDKMNELMELRILTTSMGIDAIEAINNISKRSLKEANDLVLDYMKHMM